MPAAVYALPDATAWEQAQTTYAAFQAALTALAAHLRAVRPYAAHLAAATARAGAFAAVPNPLTPTVLHIDDPDRY